MRRIILILVSAAIIGGIGWWTAATRRAPDEAVSPEKASKVLQLSLQNYQGEVIQLGEFIGTPLVINSWAAWCPFCRKELADFASAQEQFAGRVRIITIDRSESLEVAKRYTDELGVTDKLVLLLDPRDRFYQSIGGFSMPETIFVDRGGSIVFHKRGPMDLTEIRERINNLLE